MECKYCGKTVNLNPHQVWKRKRFGRELNACTRCMMSHSRSNYINSLSEEDKKKLDTQLRSANDTYWKNVSDDDIEHRSNNVKNQWRNMSKDGRSRVCQKMSESRKKYISGRTHADILKHSERSKKSWREVSDEMRRTRSKNLSVSHTNLWKTLSKDDRIKRNKKSIIALINYCANETDEQKQIRLQKSATSLIRYWNSKSNEEKELHKQRSRDRWYSKPDEEKELHKQRSIDYWKNLPDEEMDKHKQRCRDSSIDYWKNLPDDEMDNKIKKLHEDRDRYYENETSCQMYNRCYKGEIGKDHSSLEKKFIELFKSDNYILKSNKDYEKIDGIGHVWDFRIYDSNMKLLMLVGIDGYYHFNRPWKDDVLSDEDWIKRKENDLNRLLQARNSDIRFHIIQDKTRANKLDMNQYNLLLYRLTYFDSFDHNDYEGNLIYEYEQYLFLVR